MFITPIIFGNRYVTGQKRPQDKNSSNIVSTTQNFTPGRSQSGQLPTQQQQLSTVPKQTIPEGAIGQRADGSYITQKQPTADRPIDQQVQPSATDTYIKNIQARGQERIGEQQKTLGDYLRAIQEQNELRRQEAEAQKADEEAKYGKFVERARTGAQEVATASQGLKDITRENYGQALKQGAQAGREQEALLANRFANAGTIDSSAFQNAMINAKAGLVGGQQSILNEQARKLNEIESDVVNAQKKAQNLIDDEGVKLQATLRTINNTYAQGSIEYRQAVAEAYQLANENINSIRDSLDQLSYNAEQEKMKLGNVDNLSEQFLKTGVPITMNDLIFRQKNPDKAKSIYDQAQSQVGKGAGQNQNKALTMVNSLLSQDTKPITGFNRIVIPGTSGSVTKTDWEGLKSLLTLAERGQLKGSGAVSDFETKILEKAAAAGLSTDLPDEEFRRRLQILKQDLESGGATSSTDSVIRVRNLQTGETGTISASEFDPNLYQQI